MFVNSALLLEYAASPQEGSAGIAILAHTVGCSWDFRLLGFFSVSPVEKPVLELLGAALCVVQQSIGKMAVEELQTRKIEVLLLCQACISFP